MQIQQMQMQARSDSYTVHHRHHLLSYLCYPTRHENPVCLCSALDMSCLELDTEVSDNEEEADADAAAMNTLVDMIARDDNLETPSDLPGPSVPPSAFGGVQRAFAKPPRRLAHSQSFPANMT